MTTIATTTPFISAPPLSKDDVDALNIKMPQDFYDYITTKSATIPGYYPVTLSINSFKAHTQTILEICKEEFDEDETYTYKDIINTAIRYRMIFIECCGCAFSNHLDLDTGIVYYIDSDGDHPYLDRLRTYGSFTDYLNKEMCLIE